MYGLNKPNATGATGVTGATHTAMEPYQPRTILSGGGTNSSSNSNNAMSEFRDVELELSGVSTISGMSTRSSTSTSTSTSVVDSADGIEMQLLTHESTSKSKYKYKSKSKSRSYKRNKGLILGLGSGSGDTELVDEVGVGDDWESVLTAYTHLTSLYRSFMIFIILISI